jgi:MFS transporter, SP family, arabinose:H+ symporter
MVCFAVLCVLAIGFVNRFLPETKGLSVEQAVDVFEREASGSDPTPRGWIPHPSQSGAPGPS